MNYKDLTTEIENILDIGNRGNVGKGRKILQAIIKSIVTALQRGDKVYVAGFGTLYIKTRRTWAKRMPLTQLRGPKGEQLFIDIPARNQQVVTFKPSKNLKAFIKAGENNEQS